MEGACTWIQDPDNLDEEPKQFRFDHSYWSFDGFTEREADGYLEPCTPKYADQRKVFDDLGQSVLKNAWMGYNCSLFAYGQTGSGKSFSVVGYGANKGIVPVFCEELFVGINSKMNSNGSEVEYQVSFSMLEIYNEKVRDLLNPKTNKSQGLKVRQHPKLGFYVPELLNVPVASFLEISNRMNEGTQNRTVASTNMNKTSSRAHTVVTLKFTQKGKGGGGADTTKTSSVNLVDLAGSERADSTGATGDRLKEGAAINQSLSALGNVIAALAENKSGTIIPYRDSVLTKLLKNALGGNSKTIMVAAVSPADINYEETLSTLRYADRAKQIKTKAVVNESPTEKLIRELREENEKLLLLLKQGGGAPAGVTAGDEDDNDSDELKAQLEENERQMNEMKESWEQKLKEAQDALREHDNEEEQKKLERQSNPHLYNLNVDLQLTGMIVHTLKPGRYTVGNKGGTSKPDILLIGLNIFQHHAHIINKNGGVSITPIEGASIRLNGELQTSEAIIHHNDRILFGSNHLYVFQHPAELEVLKQNHGHPVKEVTYDEAQEEIARCSGIDVNSANSGDSKDEQLKEDLTDLIPMINEASAISEELDRKVEFEVCILPAIALGRLSDHSGSEVWVRMTCLVSDRSWLWSRNKFINRKYLMSEMYENYVDGEDWKLPDERDPFTESPDAEIFIGSTTVYLQNLAYLIDLSTDQYELLDYSGNNTGVITVDLIPSRADGTHITDDDNDDDLFVDDPSELVGRDVNFFIKVPVCRGLPRSIYKEVWCQYKFYLDRDVTETKHIKGTNNPDFDHSRFVAFPKATTQFVDYLTNQYVRFEVWGKYGECNTNKATRSGTTRDLVKTKKQQSGVPSGGNIPKVVDLWKKKGEQEGQKNDVQKRSIRRKSDNLEKKMALIVELVEAAEQKKKTTVKIADLRKIIGGAVPGRNSVATAQAVDMATQTNYEKKRPSSKTSASSHKSKGGQSTSSKSSVGSKHSKSSGDKSRTCSLV